MSSDRDTYKYQFVGPDRRIKHSGITNDLERRGKRAAPRVRPGRHPPGAAAMATNPATDEAADPPEADELDGAGRDAMDTAHNL